jgi:hypothetical protein
MIVSQAGVTLARHLREPDGDGVIRRLDEHRVAQEQAVLAAFGTGRRCPRKVRRPLSREALAAAAQLQAPLCALLAEAAR